MLWASYKRDDLEGACEQTPSNQSFLSRLIDENCVAFFREQNRQLEEEQQQREVLNATLEKLIEVKQKEKEERQARVDALKRIRDQNEQNGEN